MISAKWRSAVKRFFKLNHQINAPQVRVIAHDGKQIGILSIAEALKRAQEKQLDLVEIAPDAKPPVVKIIEFKKFKYLEEKKEKEARKHAKQTELKEVRFSPFIGEHDYRTATEKVKRFLEEGNLVKVSIVFLGRQMAHQEFGPKLLERIMSTLNEIGQLEREPRFEGRRYVTLVKPAKGAIRNESKNQKSSS